MTSIGRVICSFRGERRLSQRQLADDAGMPERTLQNIETGRKIPSLLMLEKIAPVLGCSVSWLLKMAEERDKEEGL